MQIASCPCGGLVALIGAQGRHHRRRPNPDTLYLSVGFTTPMLAIEALKWYRGFSPEWSGAQAHLVFHRWLAPQSCRRLNPSNSSPGLFGTLSCSLLPQPAHEFRSTAFLPPTKTSRLFMRMYNLLQVMSPFFHRRKPTHFVSF